MLYYIMLRYIILYYFAICFITGPLKHFLLTRLSLSLSFMTRAALFPALSSGAQDKNNKIKYMLLAHRHTH